MSHAWDWAEPIRRKHFSSPLAGGFVLERVEDDRDYWKLHEQYLRQHFPPEIFFNLAALRGQDGENAKRRLHQSMNADRLFDFWVAWRDGEPALMFSGHQVDDRAYRMWHSHIHPTYRKRGTYGDYLNRVIAYTKELGFEMIVSEHAPNNNAVIIAKLKAGFRIFSMEIDPMVGMSICLRYFHEPSHLAAYEFRCGYATLSEHLMANGGGALPMMVRQVKTWGKE